MTVDSTRSTTVSAPADTLFAYLSEVENLPEYFATMKEAHRTGGSDEVHTVAELPGGQEVEGEAYFRVDEAQRHIAWGSEGGSEYAGSLDVTASGDGSVVEVRIHSPHGSDEDITRGIDETLATLKKTVEEQGKGQRA